jgi:oxygen-dependent protoporphyrinogen oxidase
VVIVGGGISGLACGYFLAQRGSKATLVEKSRRLGGLLRTDQVKGCQLEAGPDSYISTKPEVTNLTGELGELRDQVIGTNDEARRIFLVHHGKLVPYPPGMVMMVPSDVRSALASDLFTVETKRAILAERFAKPRDREQDVSVAQFVLDHFDQAILEQVTEPLLMGVYGGDATRLSAKSVLPRFVEYERNCGSLLRAVRAEAAKKTPRGGSLFLSLREGMQSLADALVHATEQTVGKCNSEALGITREGSSWIIRTAEGAVRAKQVAICVPAHVAASLLEGVEPELSAELAAIPYSSAISVNLLFERKSIQPPLDGFGFLVPRKERHTVAASTWVNTKFPHRVAPGLAAIRAFIVDEAAEVLMRAPDEEITAAVEEELRRLMGIAAAPVGSVVARWPKSMPQYVVGHSARCERIRRLQAAAKGLFLVGNAYDGVGIPDCIRSAGQAVEAMLKSAPAVH